MNDVTVARQIGEIAGALIGAGILLGWFVFFIIAVIQAIKTGRKAWIVTASVFALPFFAFFALVFFGMFQSVRRAYLDARNGTAVQVGDISISNLMTAPMSPVSSAVYPYTISLPQLQSWSKGNRQDPFDLIFNCRGIFVSVIFEEMGGGSCR